MKLYNINLSILEKKKRTKPRSWKRPRSKRFYSDIDMSVIKHDIAVKNSRIKRKEIPDEGNHYIVVCGCGVTGCFIHGQFKSTNNEIH